MTTHRVDIFSAQRRDKNGKAIGLGKTSISYCGEHIGETDDEMCVAARWLLERGYANPQDELTTYRGDMPCLTGNVGWLAKRTVRESERTVLSWAKWAPFPTASILRQAFEPSGVK